MATIISCLTITVDEPRSCLWIDDSVIEDTEDLFVVMFAGSSRTINMSKLFQLMM